MVKNILFLSATYLFQKDFKRGLQIQKFNKFLSFKYHMSEAEAKKPVIKYRVELEKRLEINKSYKERRNRAIALRILSYGLFGQKRFQNLYLSCSLNCFYWALQIANVLHQRVAGLALIIKFDQVHVIEYYETEIEGGKGYAEKKYTKILIKLTKSPTEDDKKEPGYNPGINSSDIKEELTEIIGGKRPEARAGEEKGEGKEGRGPRRGGRRQVRGDRNDRAPRPEFKERPERRERPERTERRDRPERGQERDRVDRRERNDRREERPERRQDRNDRREEKPRRERRERDERVERDERRYERKDDRREERSPRRQFREREDRYGDDRDERRVRPAAASNNENKEYQRGQQRTRGGRHNNNYQNNERRDNNRSYEEKKPEEKKDRPRYESKQPEAKPARQEDRGDRRPRRNNRYSEDED